MEKEKWVLCPICNNKTRTKIRPDTVLENFPLYCPKCKQETIINLTGQNVVSCVRIASCCAGVFICPCFWSRWPEAPRCRGPPVLHFNPHSPTTF